MGIWILRAISKVWLRGSIAEYSSVLVWLDRDSSTKTDREGAGGVTRLRSRRCCLTMAALKNP
jgi:hypothetical protein